MLRRTIWLENTVKVYNNIMTKQKMNFKIRLWHDDFVDFNA